MSQASHALTADSPISKIADILIWTAACALGFEAYRQLNPGLNPTFRAFGHVYDLVMGMAFGTFAAGSLMLARRRYHAQDREALLPGHWLLLFGLAASVVDAIACGVYVALWSRSPEATPYWVPFSLTSVPNINEMRQQAVAWGLGALSSLAFTWLVRRRLSWCWKAVFLTFLLGSATLAGGHILCLLVLLSNRPAAIAWCFRSESLYRGMVVVGAVAILVAIVTDFHRHARTDRLHWTGILAWLAIAAMQLGTAWAYRYL